MAPRLLTSLFMLLSAALFSACFTALGGGIGYAIDNAGPPQEERPEIVAPFELSLHDEVIVRDGHGDRVAGEFLGLVRDDKGQWHSLLLDAGRRHGGVRRLARQDVNQIKRQTNRGTSALTVGLLLGAALDVTGIIGGILLIQSLPSHW